MKDAILLTQCFCKADILQFSMKNLYEHLGKEREHWIILKDYPINREENQQKILDYAKEYGCKIHDCGADIGATEGLNHFFDNHPELIDRKYIGFDPDTLTSAKGFDIILEEVANAAPNLAIIGLSNAAIHPDVAFCAKEQIAEKFEDLSQYKQVIAGHNVIVHPQIDMVNCCIIDARWVMSLYKRFWEPFKYYGGLEFYLFQEMSKVGKKLGYLIDYKEAYDGLLEQYKDPEYQEWKQAHLSGFPGSLKEWLIKEGKGDML